MSAVYVLTDVGGARYDTAPAPVWKSTSTMGQTFDGAGAAARKAGPLTAAVASSLCIQPSGTQSWTSTGWVRCRLPSCGDSQLPVPPLNQPPPAPPLPMPGVTSGIVYSPPPES